MSKPRSITSTLTMTRKSSLTRAHPTGPGYKPFALSTTAHTRQLSLTTRGNGIVSHADDVEIPDINQLPLYDDLVGGVDSRANQENGRASTCVRTRTWVVDDLLAPAVT